MNKYEKALSLFQNGMVSFEAKGRYSTIWKVKGEHDTYTVIEKSSGRYECDCPFSTVKEHGICSHILAVILYNIEFERKQQRAKDRRLTRALNEVMEGVE